MIPRLDTNGITLNIKINICGLPVFRYLPLTLYSDNYTLLSNDLIFVTSTGFVNSKSHRGWLNIDADGEVVVGV